MSTPIRFQTSGDPVLGEMAVNEKKQLVVWLGSEEGWVAASTPKLMTPMEVGFSETIFAAGRKILLRRGSTDPRVADDNPSLNTFFWWAPDEEDPQLLYRNHEGEWFTCLFRVLV